MNTLRGSHLIKASIELAKEIYADKTRPNGEKWIEHARRVADRALILGWPDFIIAACWLHDAFEINPIDFDAVLNKINSFNNRVGFFVDKCAFKQWEHWSDYINRISASPETRGIKWLEFLDELSECPSNDRIQVLLEALPKVTPEYFLEGNHLQK